MLCSLKAISCAGQKRYLFCTWKQIIFYTSFCWARLLISISMRREEKKEKNYFTRHIVITLAGITVTSLLGVRFLARAALPSSDPNHLKQLVVWMVWAGSSDRSVWWGQDWSRTVRNGLLSNRVCATYEPEGSSALPWSARVVFADQSDVIQTFALLTEHMQCMEAAERPSSLSVPLWVYVNSRKQPSNGNCLYSHSNFHFYCYKKTYILH